MAEFAPYDIDGGANLGYVLKRGDDDWCYRKRTWDRGPMMWPPKWVPEDSELPARMGLTELLHKIRPLKQRVV